MYEKQEVVDAALGELSANADSLGEDPLHVTAVM